MASIKLSLSHSRQGGEGFTPGSWEFLRSSRSRCPTARLDRSAYSTFVATPKTSTFHILQPVLHDPDGQSMNIPEQAVPINVRSATASGQRTGWNEYLSLRAVHMRDNEADDAFRRDF